MHPAVQENKQEAKRRIDLNWDKGNPYAILGIKIIPRGDINTLAEIKSAWKKQYRYFPDAQKGKNEDSSYAVKLNAAKDFLLLYHSNGEIDLTVADHERFMPLISSTQTSSNRQFREHRATKIKIEELDILEINKLTLTENELKNPYFQFLVKVKWILDVTSNEHNDVYAQIKQKFNIKFSQKELLDFLSSNLSQDEKMKLIVYCSNEELLPFIKRIQKIQKIEKETILKKVINANSFDEIDRLNIPSYIRDSQDFKAAIKIKLVQTASEKENYFGLSFIKDRYKIRLTPQEILSISLSLRLNNNQIRRLSSNLNQLT